MEKSLDAFFERFSHANPNPTTEWDEDWPSPCETGEPFIKDDQKFIHWQPTKRNLLADDFLGLENALEGEVHPDIKTYYGSRWSENITATAPDGPCSMLFLWSPDDINRLMENLVGHLFACQVNKTPFSVFFACTIDPDDYYLTVNNETGIVQLEQPAKKPIREIAPNLATFLDQLSFEPTRLESL